MPMWRGYGLVFRGWALAAEGRPEDGASLVRQGIAGLDALGTLFHRTHLLGLLADIHARLGDPAAGLRLLEEAYHEVARTEVRLFEAELRRLEGELRLLAGEPEAGAEACFGEALAIARRQEAKSLELRAATGLARLWRAGGKTCRSARPPRLGLRWFTEGFDTRDLRDAKALLDELR